MNGRSLRLTQHISRSKDSVVLRLTKIRLDWTDSDSLHLFLTWLTRSDSNSPSYYSAGLNRTQNSRLHPSLSESGQVDWVRLHKIICCNLGVNALALCSRYALHLRIPVIICGFNPVRVYFVKYAIHTRDQELQLKGRSWRLPHP